MPFTVAHCWARARRKLKEVFDRYGSEIAAEGLRRIADLYRIDAEIRDMGPGQRLSARQARSVPLVAEFGDWLQAQRLRVSSTIRSFSDDDQRRLRPPSVMISYSDISTCLGLSLSLHCYA